MKELSFDQLSATQFEEFCFDLLRSMGAQQMSWRKGTGHDSSPADQGRDIECQFERCEISGEKVRERWFVECKHHKAGVPPEKLQGALAWAQAEQPDYLVIIASNFLSNPAKSYIETYKQKNSPKFKIRVWELKDLEKFCLAKPDLLRKYDLGEQFPFLSLLHPAHIYYLRWPPLNTLRYFFAVVEKAGPDKYREMLWDVYMGVLNYGWEEPSDPNQTLGELLKGKLSYTKFRERCYLLARTVSQHFLVQAIVSHVLSAGIQSGDKTSLDYWRVTNESHIEALKSQAEKNPNHANTIHQCIEDAQKRLQQLPTRVEEAYGLYVSFCENVVAALFLEELETPPELIAEIEKYTGKKLSKIKMRQWPRP